MGKVIGIMGASGCGKTTLLRLIIEELKPISGTIIKDPSNLNIIYLPQEPILFEHLSIGENARLFNLIAHQKKRFDEKDYNEAVQCLELSGLLADDYNKSIKFLSGGEKQRISLLRSLSVKPDVLLLDEPCTGLDTIKKIDFLMHLKHITERFSLMVLYVTHHSDETLFIANDILFISIERKNAIFDSLENMMIKPNNIEIARTFNSPLNIVKGFIQNSVFFTEEQNLGICKLESKNDLNLPGPVFLAFKPNIVQEGNAGAISFNIQGKSQNFSHGRIEENNQSILINGTSFQNNKIKIFLNGEALLFNSERKYLDRVLVKSI